MCGGSSTTTQKTEIPPEVMARYNAVNARAESVASQPFQAYTGQFVADLSPTQKAGIAGTNAAANAAQPYYNTAAGLTLGGAQDVGRLTPEQIAQYQNPYIQSVINPTLTALQQQQGQERSNLASNAIRSGGFGGDRLGLERANLARQQTLGTAQAISPLFAQGYQQAVNTAQGQQGVVAADLARRMQAGQQYAALGTGAQGAALQGAAAQMQAGQQEQATQQADLTAKYQQFLQERGFPYQQAQFLANIAMGTGALSGSTTTTTGPSSFFSDRRLKEDVRVVGKTSDGQPIYTYKYKGDPQTHMGLMAQDVEKKHPEAVGLAGGYKTVDYEKATDDSARKHREYGGGLDPMNSMGGAVMPDMQGEAFAAGGYAAGGLPGVNEIMGQRAGMYAGLFGNEPINDPYGGRFPIPGGLKPPSDIKFKAGKIPTTPNQLKDAASTINTMASLGENAGKGWDWVANKMKPTPKKTTDDTSTGSGNAPAKDTGAGAGGGGGGDAAKTRVGEDENIFNPNPLELTAARGGLILSRRGYSTRGGVNPYGLSDDPIQDAVDAGDEKHELKKSDAGPGDPSKQQGPNPLMAAASGLTAAKGLGSIGSGLSGLTSALGGGAEAAGAAAGAAGAAAEGASVLGSLGSIGSGVAQVLPFLAMLSDERVKHHKEKIGELFDGQPVYRYDFGDGRTQIGLMAQQVEKHHPEAVAEHRGLKMVDYERATEDAAHKAHYSTGGLAPRMAFATRANVPDLSDDEFAIRTIAGEGSGDPEEAKAIAGVLANRRASGRWGDDIKSVVTAPKQFEAWSNPDAANYPMKYTEDNPKYKAAKAAWEHIREGGEDPTGGATHFYAPRAQEALARTLGDRSAVPSWAEGREGQMIGATKFYKDVDSGAPRRARTESVEGQETERDFRGAPKKATGLASYLPTKVNPETNEEEVNLKQILIPTLVGLGAMGASPSRYFGGALLQGLGAGAQAYAGLEKSQQEIAESKAREAATEMATIDASLIRDASGNLTNVILSDGKGNKKLMDFGEFWRGRKALNLSPNALQQIEEQARRSGLLNEKGELVQKGAGVAAGAPAAAPAGGVVPSARPAAAQPAEPPAAAPAALPAAAPAAPERKLVPTNEIFRVSNETAPEIKTKMNSLIGTNTAGAKNMADVASAEGAAALRQQPLVMQLGSAFADLPTEGPGVTGPGAPVIKTLGSWVNYISEGLGQGKQFNDADIKNAEKITKLVEQMKNESANASKAGQTLGAYEAIGNMIPNITLSRPGIADNFASIVVQNRAKADMADYARDWMARAQRINPSMAVPASSMIQEAFTKDHGPQLEADRKSISNMFLTPVTRGGDAIKDPTTGREINWFQYITQNGDKLTPDEKFLIEKRFGNGILRYFPNVRR
jgi:hypothetical protein